MRNNLVVHLAEHGTSLHEAASALEGKYLGVVESNRRLEDMLARGPPGALTPPGLGV